MPRSHRSMKRLCFALAGTYRTARDIHQLRLKAPRPALAMETVSSKIPPSGPKSRCPTCFWRGYPGLPRRRKVLVTTILSNGLEPHEPFETTHGVDGKRTHRGLDEPKTLFDLRVDCP